MGRRLMSKYEDAVRKAKALLAKAAENSGCTEHEKMAAYAKAHAIIDAYEITDADLEEIKQEGALFDEPSEEGTDRHSIKWRISGSVAKWCGVTIYRQRGKLTVVGLRVDVELARWALD